VPGILPRRRTTQRFKLAVFDACETFADLKSVRQKFNVSSDFIYRTYFERLDLKQRMHANRPWPNAIGIDEHGFRKRRFTTMVVAHSKHKRRVIEVVDGKAQAELMNALAEIPGRENVKYVSMDMCDAYRNFTKSFFPSAEIVADKFHILRLLSPALLRKRKEITGTNADRKARGLLLRSAKGLDYFEQSALYSFLKRYPELDEIYHFKEALHGFYRIKGQKRAQKAFIGLTDRMAQSKLKEIQTLRKTLLRWRVEVLNYFKTRITNGPVEGFNNRASLIKRRGYGYKNHKHYRLRILSACG
jgi:transposase